MRCIGRGWLGRVLEVKVSVVLDDQQPELPGDGVDLAPALQRRAGPGGVLPVGHQVHAARHSEPLALPSRALLREILRQHALRVHLDAHGQHAEGPDGLQERGVRPPLRQDDVSGLEEQAGQLLGRVGGARGEQAAEVGARGAVHGGHVRGHDGQQGVLVHGVLQGGGEGRAQAVVVELQHLAGFELDGDPAVGEDGGAGQAAGDAQHARQAHEIQELSAEGVLLSFSGFSG